MQKHEHVFVKTLIDIENIFVMACKCVSFVCSYESKYFIISRNVKAM